MKMTKRNLCGLLLGGCMFAFCVQPVFAETDAQSGDAFLTEGLCEHHTAHDEACGYTAGTVEVPCAHEHTDDCYVEVLNCVHVHTEDCVLNDSNSEEELSASDIAEAGSCSHICSEESGCITRELICPHEHDGECGYLPAVEGTPCGYVCEICGAVSGAQDPASAATVEGAEALNGLSVPLANDPETMTDVTTTGLNLTGVTEETTYKAGDGTITFKPAEDGATATLTLNNASINVSSGLYSVAAIQIPVGMPIEIIVPEGTKNSLTTGKGDGINHRGSDLKISGKGELSITATDCGITNDDDLSVGAEKESTLIIQDIVLKLNTRDDGIYEGYLTEIDSAAISAVGGRTSGSVDAINSTDILVIKNSTIEIDGAFYDGIKNGNDYSITITDSQINMNVRHGIDAYVETKIVNTTLNITSTSKGTDAIFFSGLFLIQDSTVTINAAAGKGITSTTKAESTLQIEGKSYLETNGTVNGVGMPWGTISIGTGLGIKEGEILDDLQTPTGVSTTPRFVVAPISQGGSGSEGNGGNNGSSGGENSDNAGSDSDTSEDADYDSSTLDSVGNVSGNSTVEAAVGAGMDAADIDGGASAALGIGAGDGFSSPHTGDDAEPGLWLFVLCVSFGACAAIYGLRRKRGMKL